MSGAFGVTPQELIAGSAQLSSGAGNIASQLSILRAQVDGLRATWSGGATENFSNLYARWQTSAQQLNESLLGISDLLNKAGVAYDETEAAAIRATAG